MSTIYVTTLEPQSSKFQAKFDESHLTYFELYGISEMILLSLL